MLEVATIASGSTLTIACDENVRPCWPAEPLPGVSDMVELIR